MTTDTEQAVRTEPIASIALKIFPGHGEQVVLIDPVGEEIGIECVSQDLDGYSVAVRSAARELMNCLPDIEEPVVLGPARQLHVLAREIEAGDLIAVGRGASDDWRKVTAVVPSSEDGIVAVYPEGHLSLRFSPNAPVLVRIPR